MNHKKEEIWRYLTGEMTTDEKLHFGRLIASDSLLYAELEKEKNLYEFLQTREEKTKALSNLKAVHQEMILPHRAAPSAPPQSIIGSKKSPLIRWLIPIAIAATFLIGSIYLASFYQHKTPQDLYSAYFEPTTVSLVNRSEQNSVSLATIAELFNTGAYQATVASIDQLPPAEQNQDLIKYIKAISLIASGRDQQGRTLLDRLPPLYSNEVLWYKGLSYLKEGEIQKAKASLSKITPEYNRYTQVKSILKQF